MVWYKIKAKTIHMGTLLEITASISIHKRLEFSQSLLTFIEEIKNCKGFVSFREQPSKDFQIQLVWADRNTLMEFQKTEIYRLFIGAIITLSSSYAIQKSLDENETIN